jgi:hypothetical protein
MIKFRTNTPFGICFLEFGFGHFSTGIFITETT